MSIVAVNRRATTRSCRQAHNARVTSHPSGVAIAKTNLLRPRFLTLTCLVSLVALSITPGVASAAFTRKFLRQIANTCEAPKEALTCPHSKPVVKPVALVPGGVAVDGKDDVWVEDAKEGLGGVRGGV